ncbi:endonuclease-reverse transcriptase [Elysia marginata]|uniref:Endonuclease-reverse transcriptase n=1 Tax=Elysia marginata TaxID=1093978 RepID=A0AAV4F5Z9_9GAST|nr:endonuclease-reverse transcriptase [Elysia marginata]
MTTREEIVQHADLLGYRCEKMEEYLKQEFKVLAERAAIAKKEELERAAKKEELERAARKEELERAARKEELEAERAARKEEAERIAKKEEAERIAKKEEAERAAKIELEKMRLETEMKMLQAKIQAGIVKDETVGNTSRFSDALKAANEMRHHQSPLTGEGASELGEYLLEEAISEKSGILITGVNINNIRYADDTVILVESEKQLQAMLDRIVDKCKEYDLEINAKKTKKMRIGRDTKALTITVGNAVLEQVSKYSYIGHIITEDVATLKEVQLRTGKTRQRFWENKELLRRNIGLNTKKGILACYVF